MKITMKLTRLSFVGLLVSAGACTSIPDDAGVGPVQGLVDAQIGTNNPASRLEPENALTPEQVSSLLDAPLSVDSAELLSMQLNPLARSNLLRVGIAEADYAQAGRLRNPGFTYERSEEGEYGASLLFDIGGLLLMPLRREVELRRLEAARFDAAGEVISHLANTRMAWIRAVTEKQLTELMERSLESTATANDMTRQMTALGHSAAMEAAESEIFFGEMRSALTRQRLAETAAREALIRQLGLWGNAARKLTLPSRLPVLPDSPLEHPSVEGKAIAGRLDVQIAKATIEAMASNYSLTRRSPFLSSIEFGPVMEKGLVDTEYAYELEFRIPIFDAGGIASEKARFLFEQSQDRARSIAISAASEAREAYQTYRSYWDIARYYEKVMLPLRQQVSEERLLHYNGMLISVFDLLDDVRAAADLEASAIRAVRDFWLADARLQLALTGSSPGMAMNTSVEMPATGGADAEH